MEWTMRWFGPADRVQLWLWRLIPGLSGVVPALQQQVEAVGLCLRVIESIPVYEEIKRGNARCEGRIQSFTESLRAAHAGVDGPALRRNLVAFLQAVVPEAARLGVKLALHPDDPPWPVLGLPRVVRTAEDLQSISDAVLDEYNGLTFCPGSLGARQDNDLPAMIKAFAPRIHFVHARNVERPDERNFDEVPHVSRFGSTSLAGVMRLEDPRPGVPVHPDHDRMIWGEMGRPGHGLYNRAPGVMDLPGLIDAVQERGRA